MQRPQRAAGPQLQQQPGGKGAEQTGLQDEELVHHHHHQQQVVS